MDPCEFSILFSLRFTQFSPNNTAAPLNGAIYQLKVEKVVKNTSDHFGEWVGGEGSILIFHISRGSNEYVVPIGTFIGELDGGGISYLRRFLFFIHLILVLLPVPILLLLIFLMRFPFLVNLIIFHPPPHHLLLLMLLLLFLILVLLHIHDHHDFQGGRGDRTALRVGSDAFKNNSRAWGQPCSGEHIGFNFSDNLDIRRG